MPSITSVPTIPIISTEPLVTKPIVVATATSTPNPLGVVTNTVVVAPREVNLKDARDGIAKLCFNAKMTSKNKRIPRNVVSTMVAKMNKENKGLGLSMKMVTCAVSCLYSKANAVSNSDSYEMGDAQQCKPGRPRNTTHQDMKRKESIKIKLLNNISSSYQYL